MFGYVRPLIAELKVSELNTYKAVYCGFCNKLSEKWGVFARFFLNYDFTFLVMLVQSLEQSQPTFTHLRCPYKPFKKIPHLVSDHPLDFAADSAAIMFHYKYADDIADSSSSASLKSRLLQSATKPSFKTASERLPEVSEAVRVAMNEQYALEADNPSLDRACHPTAQALGQILAVACKNSPQREDAERFGYMLGRYVYLCDALDDRESDIKSGNFNPLIGLEPERIEQAFYHTIFEAQEAYSLLNLHYFKEITDNIVYLGLENTFNLIRNGEKHSSNTLEQ